MACIAANLGLGLDYNEATRQIDLRISTDAGNAAQIGSNRGFYAPAVTGPGPMTWRKTVATLPAQAIAVNGGGSLVGPATAPGLIEYAIANDMDIYATGTFAHADDVPFDQIGSLTQSVGTYTDNPSDAANRYLSSLTVQSLNYDAGTRVNPTGRNTGAPSSYLSPDGGWGGFYAPQYKARTLSETLRLIRGRMVVSVSCQRLGLTAAQIEAEIRATVETVVQAGAQAWVVIHIAGVLDDNTRAPLSTWVPIVTGAGIAAGVNITAEASQVGAVWTAAEIVATGATWVELRGGSDPAPIAESRITEMVTAGLKVQAWVDGRQYWVDRSFDLGVRSVRVPDGVYARGATTHPKALTYRRTMVPGLATGTPDIGAMTPKTAVEQALFNAGFARSDQPGRWFPEGYGWSGSVGVNKNHQLLGSICPIPNATNYRIRIRVRRENSTTYSSSQLAALFFASADDRDISNVAGQASKSYLNGYWAVLRSQPTSGTFTSIQLYKVTAGVQTSLASISNGASWRVGEWALMTVTVSPTQVIYSATDSVTTSTVTVNDTAYRGAYAFTSWDDQVGKFMHGYDNPTDLVMYEALS